ncbi:MAG: hypothetical protein NZ455_07000 [Bacteroidia bacterium]|nr:hypothetical protein [Bacteroidia bacterium]MDW8345390.1 hypothetical protein [Bacteroidia bacterium]
MNDLIIYSFEIQNWDERWETGILLQENENWVLLANIPTEYIIDGYKLIAKEHISYKYREDNEKSHEKFFKLKNIHIPRLPQGFVFQPTAIQMLSWIEQRYSFFEFKDYDEYEGFVGRLKTIQHPEGIFTIDYLFNDGTLDTEYETEFFQDEVSVIYFDTYYLRAVTFLYQENSKGKPAEITSLKKKRINRK